LDPFLPRVRNCPYSRKLSLATWKLGKKAK
jgi:hypothetical protein